MGYVPLYQAVKISKFQLEIHSNWNLVATYATCVLTIYQKLYFHCYFFYSFIRYIPIPVHLIILAGRWPIYAI